MYRHLIFAIALCNLLVAGSSMAQSNRIDSLKSVIKNTTDDSIRVSALLQVGFHYIFNNSDTAWKYIIDAEQISNLTQMTYAKVNTISVKGIYYDVTGKLDSARHYFETGYALSKENNFPDLEAKFVNSLGMNSWNQGYYNMALEYFFNVLEVNEKVEESKRVPVSTPYNNIGLIYQELGQYEKALEYHYKALDYRQKDPALIAQVATSFNNIGICLNHLKKYDDAEKAYRDGISIAQQHNFLRQYYDLATNLANTLMIVGRYDEALKYRFEVKRNEKNLKLPDKFLMNNEGHLAGIYVMLRQPAKAIAHIQNGLQIIEKNPEVEFYASDLYRYGSSAYFMIGDVEKGGYFSTKLSELQENRFSKNNAESMAEMEVRYNTTLKENEILKLKSENEEAELNLARAELEAGKRERTLYIVTGLSVIVLLGLFIWYRWTRIKLQLAEEQKINNAIFLSEQHERVRIARDIHDSIGQKLSVQKMLLSKVSGEVNIEAHTDLKHASVLLDETVSELRSISHNLIPHELNLGLMKALAERAEEINEVGNVKVVINFSDPLPETDTMPMNHQLSIYRIIQEILSNMITHAQAATISIKVGKQAEALHFAISDDGRGFDPRKINESSGIGWKNIIARAQLISAKLTISSEFSKGTRIELMVPVGE